MNFLIQQNVIHLLITIRNMPQLRNYLTTEGDYVDFMLPKINAL